MNHTSVAPRVVEYPSSDGQPMAETPVHREVRWTRASCSGFTVAAGVVIALRYS